VENLQAVDPAAVGCDGGVKEADALFIGSLVIVGM